MKIGRQPALPEQDGRFLDVASTVLAGATAYSYAVMHTYILAFLSELLKAVFVMPIVPKVGVDILAVPGGTDRPDPPL